MKTLKVMMATLVLGLFTAMASVTAQDMDSAADMDISDETLVQFVSALEVVGELSVTYSEQIAEAETPEAAQELQMQAQDEMVAAVEDAGLTVQDYNMIAQAMSQNPELMERVESML